MKLIVPVAVVVLSTTALVAVYYSNSKHGVVDLSESVPEGTVEYIQWYDEVCTVITENRQRAQRLSENTYPRYSQAWAHREVQALQEWTRAGEFDRARERWAKLAEINRSSSGLRIDRLNELAAHIEWGEIHSQCSKQGKASISAIKRLQKLASGDGLTENQTNGAWLEQYLEKLAKNPESCDQYGQAKSSNGFFERSQELGISVMTRAGGVITEDLNGDERPDIVTSSHGFGEQLKVHLAGKGNDQGWSDETKALGLGGMPGGLNIVQADYDNDGWVDLYISRGAWLVSKGEVPDSLLKNIGGKHFEDVTEDSGLWAEGPTQVAQWQDYDGDGLLDLFVGYESQAKWSMSGSGEEEIDTEASVIYSNKLFRNKGNGKFEEVGEAVGLDGYGFIKGASWGQLVGDEYPDLLISVYGGKNAIYENIANEKGERVFRKHSELEAPIFSFASWVWDINHDGLDDIFIANFRVPMEDEVAPLMGQTPESPANELYLNRGKGRFERVSEETGLSAYPMSVMGANFGDINNDGYFDAFFGTGSPSLERWVPNRLMVWNPEGERFSDQTEKYNMGVMGKGHGIAFADMNQDGQQDIYASFGGWYEADESRNRYFENHIENDNQWVQLKLEGTQSNRSAIGAKVEIKVVTADGKEKSFFHTINSGGSFGANSLTLHAGLGEINAIKEVVVTWPRAGYPKQHYKGVETNQAWHLVESLAEPKRLYD